MLAVKNRYMGVSLDDEFVEFLLRTREDREMREWLTWLLSIEPVERKVLLCTLLGRMSRQGCQERLIELLRLLLIEEVADCALQILNTRAPITL